MALLNFFTFFALSIQTYANMSCFDLFTPQNTNVPELTRNTCLSNCSQKVHERQRLQRDSKIKLVEYFGRFLNIKDKIDDWNNNYYYDSISNLFWNKIKNQNHIDDKSAISILFYLQQYDPQRKSFSFQRSINGPSASYTSEFTFKFPEVRNKYANGFAKVFNLPSRGSQFFDGTKFNLNDLNNGSWFDLSIEAQKNSVKTAIIPSVNIHNQIVSSTESTISFRLISLPSFVKYVALKKYYSIVLTQAANLAIMIDNNNDLQMFKDILNIVQTKPKKIEFMLKDDVILNDYYNKMEKLRNLIIKDLNDYISAREESNNN